MVRIQQLTDRAHFLREFEVVQLARGLLRHVTLDVPQRAEVDWALDEWSRAWIGIENGLEYFEDEEADIHIRSTPPDEIRSAAIKTLTAAFERGPITASLVAFACERMHPSVEHDPEFATVRATLRGSRRPKVDLAGPWICFRELEDLARTLIRSWKIPTMVAFELWTADGPRPCQLRTLTQRDRMIAECLSPGAMVESGSLECVPLIRGDAGTLERGTLSLVWELRPSMEASR